MEKKKLIYIIGGVAIIGLAYYFYNKNKKSANRNGQPLMGGQQPPTDEQPPKDENSVQEPPKDETTKTENIPAKDLTKKEARKQNKEDSLTYMAICGKKPSFKKNQPAWQKCVDEQKAKALKGGSAFDGASNYFELTSNMTGEITDNMDIF